MCSYNTANCSSCINQCLLHISAPLLARVPTFVYVNCDKLGSQELAQICDKSWSSFQREQVFVLVSRMAGYLNRHNNTACIIVENVVCEQLDEMFINGSWVTGILISLRVHFVIRKSSKCVGIKDASFW